MKILALSDIHGDIDRLKKLKAKIHQIDHDLLVVAGDLTFGDSKESAEKVVNYLENGKPIFAVGGNWDGENVKNLLDKKKINLHNQPVHLGNMGIMGFAGPAGFSMGGLMFLNYDNLDKTFEEVAKSEKTVVVSHHPPSNTELDKIFTGQHVGSEFVRDLIEEKQPDLLICGHIHEAKGVEKIKKTTVVNTGAVCDGYAALIDFTGREPKTEFIRI